MSAYVPGWIKKDVKRFPRARVQTSEGSSRPVEVISPLSEECLKADTRAFRALMQHLHGIDGGHGTVIMVQVENEVGILGDSRDRSDMAATTFNSPVPEDLIRELKAAAKTDRLNGTIKKFLGSSLEADGVSSKTWGEVFGKSLQTDELFMAYHYARYVDTVGCAGKEVYALPLYTNAWLPASGSSSSAGGGAKPGVYPSGGPTNSVLDIWQIFAPTLDAIGPDIYLVDYEDMFKKYTHNGKPLFIPEHRRDEFGALRIWDAIGSYGGLAVSPFGIDTLDATTSPWTKHLGLLRKAGAHILRARQEGMPITGFHFDRFERGTPSPDTPKVVDMGEWTLTIERAAIFGQPEPGYGLVIQQGPDSFLLVGEGFMVSFKPKGRPDGFGGILSFVELECVDEDKGEMRRLRRLNGDETKSGKNAVMPTLGDGPDYSGFPIAITIPGETGLAQCEAYTIEDDA